MHPSTSRSQHSYAPHPIPTLVTHTHNTHLILLLDHSRLLKPRHRRPPLHFHRLRTRMSVQQRRVAHHVRMCALSRHGSVCEDRLCWDRMVSPFVRLHSYRSSLFGLIPNVNSFVIVIVGEQADQCERWHHRLLRLRLSTVPLQPLPLLLFRVRSCGQHPAVHGLV